MEQARFLNWRANISVVYGARRAAIYDFETGLVYALNSEAALIARQIDAGVPITTMSTQERQFANHLHELGLGGFGNRHIPQPDEGSNAKVPGLDFLWLELTGTCNLGCSHCYAGTQNPALVPQTEPVDSKGTPLSVNEWCRVIEDAAGIGCHNLQFIGGEVLLHRHLLYLINAAQSNGFTFIEVYSNGTLLHERVVAALAKLDVQVAISVHGTKPEVHDAVTGVPGSFERTLRSLRLLQDYGIHTRVAGVAMQVNQDDIIDLQQLTSELGFGEPSYDVIRPIGSGDDPSLAPDSVEALAPKWLTQPDFVADWASYNHNISWNPCWAGKLAITNTGDAMPCIMGRSEVVGNVREASLAQIMENPRLLDLWGLTKDQVDICRTCEYRYVCDDCRPLAHVTSGDLRGAYPRCTYDPVRGVWDTLTDESPSPGPAPEAVEPDIALATKSSSLLHVRFSCTPDNSQHQVRRRVRCSPDRQEGYRATLPPAPMPS